MLSTRLRVESVRSRLDFESRAGAHDCKQNREHLLVLLSTRFRIESSCSRSEIGSRASALEAMSLQKASLRTCMSPCMAQGGFHTPQELKHVIHLATPCATNMDTPSHALLKNRIQLSTQYCFFRGARKFYCTGSTIAQQSVYIYGFSFSKLGIYTEFFGPGSAYSVYIRSFFWKLGPYAEFFGKLSLCTEFFPGNSVYIRSFSLAACI